MRLWAEALMNQRDILRKLPKLRLEKTIKLRVGFALCWDNSSKKKRVENWLWWGKSSWKIWTRSRLLCLINLLVNAKQNHLLEEDVWKKWIIRLKKMDHLVEENESHGRRRWIICLKKVNHLVEGDESSVWRKLTDPLVGAHRDFSVLWWICLRLEIL